MNIHLLDLTAHRNKRKSPSNDRINPPRLLLEAFVALIALGACSSFPLRR